MDALLRIAFLALLILPACARPKPASSRSGSNSVVSMAESLEDRYACLQEVLAKPTLEVDSQANFHNSRLSAPGVESIRIETPMSVAADAPVYTLCIDENAGLVYVVASGGIGDRLKQALGPWPISDAKVSELVERARMQSGQR